MTVPSKCSECGHPRDSHLFGEGVCCEYVPHITPWRDHAMPCACAAYRAPECTPHHNED